MLLHLGALLEALGARRDDERGVPARAQLAIDAGDHDVDVGDPAVGRPGLLAVEDPFVLGLVVARRGANRGDVGPGVGLRGAEGGHLRLLRRPVALRHPLDQLVGGARGVDPGHCQRRAHDRQADPGVAPEQLLVGDRQLEPGRVGPELGERLEAVEADLRGLLDDRPRRLLALVPLGGRRADHLLGEPVHPVADLPLVLAQLEAERGGVVLLVAVDRGGNGLLGAGGCLLWAGGFHGSPWCAAGRASACVVRLPYVTPIDVTCFGVL